MGFIIKSFCRFRRWDRENCVYEFEVNEIEYGIMKVRVIDGLPQVPEEIEYDARPDTYYVYGTEDEARKFAAQVQRLNYA